uniref:Uncharacterized protein n=1 Tax=Arundo donax TaxID=35708 RepID=A0A0A8YC54_ARUDO
MKNSHQVFPPTLIMSHGKLLFHPSLIYNACK